MNSAADRQTGGVVPGGALDDVSEMPFEDLLEEDSALVWALRRLTQEAHSHEDLYAGFGNFAPTPSGPPAVAA
jgi:hypothetical protein